MSTPPQMTSGATSSSSKLMDRIMGVITLKAPMYREIADDTTATSQAAIIVAIVSLLGGIGAGLTRARGDFGQAILVAIVTILLAFIGWAVSSWVLAFVAGWFGGKTNTGEMLRVTGYVDVFYILNALLIAVAFLPVLVCIVAPILLIVAILRLIGFVIGVREAAEFTTGKAIVTAIVAIIVLLIIEAVIGGIIFGAMGLGSALAGGGQ